jgi:ankyrin repeat protein
MRLLIQHGANVDGPVDEVMEHRPLGKAITSDQPEAVKLLLQAGASDLQEALVCAAQRGRLEAMQLLLEHGVEDIDDRVVFYAAGYHIAWPVVEHLLQAPPSCTASAQEQENQLSNRLGVALCGAAGAGNKEVVQKVFEYQEHLAASSGVPLLSKPVLNQAAAMAAARKKPVLYVHPSGAWRLHLDLSHCKEHKDFPGVVKLLIDQGADVAPDCARLLKRRGY